MIPPTTLLDTEDAIVAVQESLAALPEISQAGLAETYNRLIRGLLSLGCRSSSEVRACLELAVEECDGVMLWDAAVDALAAHAACFSDLNYLRSWLRSYPSRPWISTAAARVLTCVGTVEDRDLIAEVFTRAEVVRLEELHGDDADLDNRRLAAYVQRVRIDSLGVERADVRWREIGRGVELVAALLDLAYDGTSILAPLEPSMHVHCEPLDFLASRRLREWSESDPEGLALVLNELNWVEFFLTEYAGVDPLQPLHARPYLTTDEFVAERCAVLTEFLSDETLALLVAPPPDLPVVPLEKGSSDVRR